MPAAADKSAKPTVEVTKQGKYNIVVGDSLKRENGHGDGDLFSSVKYNFKPPSSLVNSVPPRLTKNEAGGEAPYTLTLTPPSQPSPNHIVYEGAQHIPKKTECILLFDPAKQTFTLEKLSSAFTFNAKVFANAHPPLPLRPPVVDGDDDEISAEEKEDDNPFDYRHFLNKKATTKSRAEQRAEKEERRKKALIAAGALSENPDESEGEKGGKDEEESGLGLGITYGGRLPISNRASKSYTRKAGGKSPIIGGRKNLSAGHRDMAIPSPGARDQVSSSEESEADNEDNGEDDEHYRAPPRHVSPPHKPAPKNTRANEDDDMEIVFDFPDMVTQPPEEEEEISDVDEDSDDEPNPPRAPQQAVPVAPGQDEEGEEEEDDDGFNLAEELEQALESEEDPAPIVQGGDSEIIFEDDDATSRPKLGLVHKSAVPISLSGMVGGGVLDESESSEEE